MVQSRRRRVHTEILIDMYAYIGWNAGMYISLLFQIKGPRSKDTPIATSQPSIQFFISNVISNQRNQGSLKTWPVLDLRQKTHKVSLEHPESKKVWKHTDILPSQCDTGAQEPMKEL